MKILAHRRGISLLVTAASVVLMLVYVLVHSPTFASWASQSNGFDPIAVSRGSASVIQEIKGVGRPLDAVLLMLPTESNALDGMLHVEVFEVPERRREGSGIESERATASVDLSGIQDWGMHLFRLSPPLSGTADTYALALSAEDRAYVAAGSGNPYPQGTLTVDDAASASDLIFRAYEDVGWGRYVVRVSDSSETKAPVWLLAVVLLAVPVLFASALASLAFVEGESPAG